MNIHYFGRHHHISTTVTSWVTVHTSVAFQWERWLSLPRSPGVPGTPAFPGKPGVPGGPCSPGVPGDPGLPGSPGGPWMVRTDEDWLGSWLRMAVYLAMWPETQRAETSFNELSHAEREDWRYYLSRLRNILLDNHKRKSTPLWNMLISNLKIMTFYFGWYEQLDCIQGASQVFGIPQLISASR